MINNQNITGGILENYVDFSDLRDLAYSLFEDKTGGNLYGHFDVDIFRKEEELINYDF